MCWLQEKGKFHLWSSKKAILQIFSSFYTEKRVLLRLTPKQLTDMLLIEKKKVSSLF